MQLDMSGGALRSCWSRLPRLWRTGRRSGEGSHSMLHGGCGARGVEMDAKGACMAHAYIAHAPARTDFWVVFRAGIGVSVPGPARGEAQKSQRGGQRLVVPEPLCGSARPGNALGRG